jgi:protein tyrosine phosphatase (PTP) superfamily phosphohydrolase (DUF442 family)
MNHLHAAACLSIASAVVFAGCSAEPRQAQREPAAPAPQSAAAPTPSAADAAASTAALVASAARDPRKLEDPAGLHNLIEVVPGVFSGSQPEGDEGFDSLKALGVRTVISVDGVTPDLERAHARGMRYAHVPVQYRTITREQQLQIAAVIRDLPGPVFIHCHHGKHRGPTAAALGLMAIGRMTPDEGAALQRTAKTSPHYAGLYEAVAMNRRFSPAELALRGDAVPEAAIVSGTVAVMARVDEIFAHLRDIERAGWKAPPNHPDLVPAAEAAQMHNALRSLEAHEETTKLGEDYVRLMIESARAAQALEDAIVAGQSASELSAALKRLDTSCIACHKAHRDN